MKQWYKVLNVNGIGTVLILSKQNLLKKQKSLFIKSGAKIIGNTKTCISLKPSLLTILM